jgi:hypothetical protein
MASSPSRPASPSSTTRWAVGTQPLTVDAAIDDPMGDVDSLRTILTGHALADHSKTGLRGGKMRITRLFRAAPGGTCEKCGPVVRGSAPPRVRPKTPRSNPPARTESLAESSRNSRRRLFPALKITRSRTAMSGPIAVRMRGAIRLSSHNNKNWRNHACTRRKVFARHHDLSQLQRHHPHSTAKKLNHVGKGNQHQNAVRRQDFAKMDGRDITCSPSGASAASASIITSRPSITSTAFPTASLAAKLRCGSPRVP